MRPVGGGMADVRQPHGGSSVPFHKSGFILRYLLEFLESFLMTLLLKRPRCFPDYQVEKNGQNYFPNQDENQFSGLVSLPDLALENILGRLDATSLLQTSHVCRELRARCRSDHLWEALVFEKWGKLAGPDLYRKHLHAPAGEIGHCLLRNQQVNQHHILWNLLLKLLWPPSWINLLAMDCCWEKTMQKPLPVVDSLLAWYWALEMGTFSFRGQVYNREGHVGFILSCYDAELSYDRSTDTFRARYPPHGSRTIVLEESIPWERLRPFPVESSAYCLHDSDCLAELKPGDHVEVQWRRNKVFPYGWWYGMIGHADSCTRNDCSCHFLNTIWLVFNQYTLNSRWRRTAINRRNHREEGNEGEGYYGGIRKLRTTDEISNWERLRPAEILE